MSVDYFKKYLPNPVFVFTLGFAYYLLSPVFVMFVLLDGGFDYTYQLLHLATNYMDVFFFDKSYFVDLIVIYVSFYIGYRALSFWHGNRDIKDKSIDSISSCRFCFKLLVVINSCLFGMLMIYGLYSGVDFFSGYREFNVVFLGTLSTLAFLNVFLWIFFAQQRHSYLLLALFLVCAVTLLGLGTRNVVLNGIFAFLAYMIFKKPEILKDYRLYFGFFLILILVVLVGIWRTGYEFSLHMVISQLFAEATFVLASASCYLQNVGVRPIVEFPYSLIAGIINFVPSILFPEKIKLIAGLVNNPDIYSPYGASSILVNMYSNFGYLYPIFIILLSMGFTYIYLEAKNSTFFRTVYLSIFPLLIFQVFNQPLYSLLKLSVYNGLILPAVVLYAVYFFAKALKLN